jgi:hypothetical protein
MGVNNPTPTLTLVLILTLTLTLILTLTQVFDYLPLSPITLRPLSKPRAKLNRVKLIKTKYIPSSPRKQFFLSGISSFITYFFSFVVVDSSRRKPVVFFSNDKLQPKWWWKSIFGLVASLFRKFSLFHFSSLKLLG